MILSKFKDFFGKWNKIFPKTQEKNSKLKGKNSTPRPTCPLPPFQVAVKNDKKQHIHPMKMYSPHQDIIANFIPRPSIKCYSLQQKLAYVTRPDNLSSLSRSLPTHGE